MHEIEHITSADWARKELAGAAVQREWVGENDESISLRGKVFPHFIRAGMTGDAAYRSGGLSHLDALDTLRRLGTGHLLMRGDGVPLGWYIIETLTRGHSFLDDHGVGQVIDFHATFQRVPKPGEATYYTNTIFAT